MLKKDKNGFIDIIIENGFKPTDFDAFEEHRDNFSAFVIKHKASPLEFWARNPDDSYFQYDCCYIPFSPTLSPTEYIPDHWANSINEIYVIFSSWLKHHLKSYIEEQIANDMWRSFTEARSKDFNWESINEESTELFNDEEKKLLFSQIAQFRNRLIQQYSPSDELLHSIDIKLNYLTEAIDRLNKFDWKSLLISTLIGLATTMSLDKDSGQTLIEMAKSIFNNALLLLN